MRRTFLLSLALSALATSFVVSRTGASPLTSPTLAELAPQWWRWRVALPAMTVPDKDTAGHFCDVGQSEKTWFLAGLLSFGAPSNPTRRTCVVPAGRRLFFPVVTVLRITHEGVSCSKAQDQVTSSIDHASDLSATLDGKNLLAAAGASRWGSAGICFPLKLAADGPSANLTAAADGYWLLIDPLPAGRHTLVYGGSLPADATDQARVQATTYELEVE